MTLLSDSYPRNEEKASPPHNVHTRGCGLFTTVYSYRSLPFVVMCVTAWLTQIMGHLAFKRKQ